MTVRRELDDMVHRYIHGIGAAHAYKHDPMFHYSFFYLRQILGAMEMAMEDEHIPEDVRMRVLRAVLYGSGPSVADAEERIRLKDEEIEHLLKGVQPQPRTLITGF